MRFQPGFRNPKPAAGGITGLLDTYPGAAFAYSFRKLRNAYAGSAVRIRRSSDDAETNVGFDGSGNFDSAAAATHIGGGSGFVVTWFDQSGNGLDVSQATSGQQPGYSASAVGGIPGCVFTGSANVLFRNAVDMSNYITANANVIMAINWNATAGVQAFFDWNEVSTSNRFLMAMFNNQIYWDFGNDTTGRVNSTLGAEGTAPAEHIFQVWRDSSDGQYWQIDNNSSHGPDTRTKDVTTESAVWCIGADTATAANDIDASMSEIIGWGPYIGDANRAAILTDVNAYYTVF
jgi:hypothetical protein